MSRVRPRRLAPAPAPRLLPTLGPIYAAAALRLLVPLWLLPLMASRLGADTFGRLGFITVWGGLLSLVVEGGFLASATRLAVRADDAARWALASRVVTARAVLTFAVVPMAAVVVLVAAPGAAPSSGDRAADALAIAVMAVALGWPASWYLQATQQLGRWARIEFVTYAGLLAASVWLAHGLWSYLALQVLASAALAWCGWRWLRGDLGLPRQQSTTPSSAGAVAPAAALWSRSEVGPGLRLAWTMLPVSIAGAAYSYALPAIASGRLTAAELGVYFLADRVLRALMAAADPVLSVVYPRIVARFAGGPAAALRYAAGWAAGGFLAGAGALAAVAASRPLWEPLLVVRLDAGAARQVADVIAVLGWLLPLLVGWKFIGYWMLGSGRCDRAYRSCLYAGGAAGVAGAALWPGARTAVGLAQVALASEGVVIAVAVAGAWLTLRRPA